MAAGGSGGREYRVHRTRAIRARRAGGVAHLGDLVAQRREREHVEYLARRTALRVRGVVWRSQWDAGSAAAAVTLVVSGGERQREITKLRVGPMFIGV